MADHKFSIGDRVRRITGAGLAREVYVVEAFDDSVQGLPGYRVRPERPRATNKHPRLVLERWLQPAEQRP